MTASTEAGVEEFNDETGSEQGKVADTVSTPTPQEPDQPEEDTPKKTGGVQPRDNGIPHGHILTEDES